MWQALALQGLVVEVVAHSAFAVLWQAATGTGVPVEAFRALLVWCAEALACDVVEVLGIGGAWALRVLSTLALALGIVPNREDGLT